MIDIYIADTTLREKANSLSFKEKIELARQMDKLRVDVIETPAITHGKTDILFLHTIAPIIQHSRISCPVGLTEESVQIAYEAVREAKNPRLHVMVPVSTVQMEYLCHKKPDKVLALIETLVSAAAGLCEDVEVSLLDSTRAEREFLSKAIEVAIASGAKTVTLCDLAGEMLPAEFTEFLGGLYEAVPTLKDVVLSVECSNELRMAVASAISCVEAGARQIKTVMYASSAPSIQAVARVFRAKAERLGIQTGVDMTVLERSVKQLGQIINEKAEGGLTQSVNSPDIYSDDIKLSTRDDLQTVATAVAKMGYDLADEDLKAVYEAFLKIADKKTVGSKELDAIVASSAMQVAPTYKLKSYVINSGNILTPTANIELEKNGTLIHGFCIGDGPIDASFRAIEQITGHHYELDDFQIQSVTRGREAVGESIVKLRYEGKLFSGKGTSTDVVGASINAYINALNKICFEEGMA